MHFLSLPLSPPLPNLPPRRRRFTSVNPLSPLPPSTINSSHLRRAISPFERKRVPGGPREKKRKKWRATLFCTMWPKKNQPNVSQGSVREKSPLGKQSSGKIYFLLFKRFFRPPSPPSLLLLTQSCLLKKHAPGLTYAGRTDTEAAWEKKGKRGKKERKKYSLPPPFTLGRRPIVHAYFKKKVSEVVESSFFSTAP